MKVDLASYRNLPIFLKIAGVAKAEFEEEYKEWQKNNSDKIFNHFMWEYFQNTAIRLSKEAKNKLELYQNMRDAYGQMIFFRVYHEQENASILMKDFQKYVLLAAQETNLKCNAKVIGISDCSVCTDLPDADLEEEIKSQRLPFENFPRVKSGLYNSCGACYGFTVLRDERGLPMLINNRF